MTTALIEKSVSTVPRSESAIFAHRGRVAMENRTVCSPASNEILVRVAVLGLCRTDLRVLSGEIQTDGPRVPGHEFSGTVEAIGSAVEEFEIGERVVVNPLLACGKCGFCRQDRFDSCQNALFLGVDVDGACAETIAVPSSSVYSIPLELSFEDAVFTEPIAASLAVLKADLRPEERGLILGNNRIAEMVKRVLDVNGIRNVVTCGLEELKSVARDCFDFAIETIATTESVKSLIGCLKPRGKLILKSRQTIPLQFTLRDLLPKEPRMFVVNYGSFQQAIDLLSTRSILVADLIGKRFALADFAMAIAAAEESEFQKVFLYPQPISRTE